jgi:RNA polymerase subunit RPABC4/transcription elongation factor Spt4
MSRFKSCTRCPRVFEKPHKYVSVCPKCRQELKEKKKK